VCGGRALAVFDRQRDLVGDAARLLTVAGTDVPATVARLQTELKDQQRRVKHLQGQAAAHLAADLRAGAVPGRHGARVVIQEQPGWDADALKSLAAAIVSTPGMIVVLAGEGQPVPIVVARSADVTFDAGGWMKEATSVMGGRGGGRPELAQGGLAAEVRDILARAKDTLG